MDDVRDFLILHYAMTQGRTEPMWQACQAMDIPETLARKIGHFRASARLVLSTDELFRDASWFAVMDGQGIRPTDYNPAIESHSIEDIMAHLQSVRTAIQTSAAAIPALQRPASQLAAV